MAASILKLLGLGLEVSANEPLLWKKRYKNTKKELGLKVAGEERKFSSTLLYSAAPAINFLARKPKLFFRSRPLAQTFASAALQMFFSGKREIFLVVEAVS